MPKPIIGLTTTHIPRLSHPPVYGTNQPYAEAVRRSGGLPLLIPNNLAEPDLVLLLSRLDGILFTGGDDVDPDRYGGGDHALVEKVDPERDWLEISLVKAAVQHGTPFLGICRGMQVINVALGGSLYEDLLQQLPGSLQHDNHGLPRDYLAHPVRVESDSRLSEILGEGITRVNSLHHQGLRQLAPELLATAVAADGVVEGIELPGQSFSLAVQWHPEELQEHEAMRLLFRAFIHACHKVETITGQE